MTLNPARRTPHPTPPPLPPQGAAEQGPARRRWCSLAVPAWRSRGLIHQRPTQDRRVSRPAAGGQWRGARRSGAGRHCRRRTVPGSRAVVHQPEIGRAREDVVARIVRVSAQSEPSAHLRPGAGYQLHQPHRASTARDRPLMQDGSAAALSLNHPFDPGRGHPEPRRGHFDIGPPALKPIRVSRWSEAERQRSEREPQRAHISRALPTTSPASVGPK